MKATHDRTPLLMGDHYAIPTKAGDTMVTTLLDIEDTEILGRRKLSLGSHGYVQMFADGKVQLLHRWLLGVSGGGYSEIVDHLNRNKLDNRRSNLRITDGSVSNANRPQADGVFTSVFRTRSGRYQAKFRWRREKIYLGTFDSEEAAAAAVSKFRETHYPDSIPPQRQAS